MSAAVAQLPSVDLAPVPAVPAALSPQVRQRLSVLREAASAARVMPSDDLFRACSVLGDDTDADAAGRYAVALMRVLPDALGGVRVRCFEAGASEVSFDESWILAGLDAANRNDEPSLSFLLASRLPKHSRRQVGFLVKNLAQRLDARAV